MALFCPGHHRESVRRVKIFIDEMDSNDSMLAVSHRPAPSAGKHQASGSDTKVAAASGSDSKLAAAIGTKWYRLILKKCLMP
ncbi:hypothetical protein GUJ93_ZPchr0005g14771 [Zizania palustris]|uniref:Uncharacterized protein n=1 Tax=Zizania palustris TaxID=103762 RepID=A0A8J5VID0_ZIZPA|nr:hypothetical protein GUJ93_ZPchr0005g14771 [Zizania palustris]